MMIEVKSKEQIDYFAGRCMINRAPGRKQKRNRSSVHIQTTSSFLAKEGPQDTSETYLGRRVLRGGVTTVDVHVVRKEMPVSCTCSMLYLWETNGEGMGAMKKEKKSNRKIQGDRNEEKSS